MSVSFKVLKKKKKKLKKNKGECCKLSLSREETLTIISIFWINVRFMYNSVYLTETRHSVKPIVLQNKIVVDSYRSGFTSTVAYTLLYIDRSEIIEIIQRSSNIYSSI